MEARFNPTSGEWENLAPPPMSRAARQSAQEQNPSRASNNIFKTLNNGVATTGNAIAVFYNILRTLVAKLTIWIFCAASICTLLYFALNGEWVSFIAIGAVAVIAYYLLSYLIAIAVSIVFLPLAVLRFVFKNLATLLIFITIFVAGLYLFYNPDSDRVPPQTYVCEEIQPQWYICTARVLNIRNSPSTDAPVIGALLRGQRVSVTDYYYSGDFAEITFNNSKAYVARQYIEIDE